MCEKSREKRPFKSKNKLGGQRLDAGGGQSLEAKTTEPEQLNKLVG